MDVFAFRYVDEHQALLANDPPTSFPGQRLRAGDLNVESQPDTRTEGTRQH